MTEPYDTASGFSAQAAPAGLAAQLLLACRRLYRCPDPAALPELLLQAARGLTGCARAALLTPDPDRETRLLVRAALGQAAPPPGQAALPAGGLAALAADADGLAAALPALAGAAWGSEQLTAPVALPARGESRLYGLLLCDWDRVEDQPAHAAATLAALVEDAGHAMDGLARGRSDEAERALQAINAVSELGLLYGTLLDRLLSAILTQILEATRLGAGAIYLYEEQGEQLSLAISASHPSLADSGAGLVRLWRQQRLAHCAALAAQTAQGGREILVLATDEGEHEKLGEELRQEGVSELVSLPMLAGGWLTGVLQVTPVPGQAASAGQRQMLRLVARETAIAVENARLFAQTRAEQERAQAVVDATNDAILMLDERRRAMIINRRARFFFGLADHDLYGREYEQLSTIFAQVFEDGLRFNAWLNQLLHSTTERAVEEFRTIRPERRLLQCFSAPVLDQHDRQMGRILVFRDITREREVERMKNDFVSIVSHELRTPLTSIQGALQLVLGQGARPGLAGELPQRARELLRISLNNSERLIRLINDILDIAKIEQGRIQLRRVSLDPAAICRSAADDMAALANNHGVTIEISLLPPLPPVYADRDRTLQILVNLLSNAIKFSSGGQRVVLSARREGPAICFAVRDWGRGITPEDQARLFQKFQQIDSSSTREAGGSGLGLAISRALVEEHGGRMWIESAPAQGSTFTFTLPIVESALADLLEPLPRRVLLITEQDERRAALRAALEQVGVRVVEAGLIQGLEAVQTLRPELLLVDVDGLSDGELIRRLRAEALGQAMILLVLSDSEQPREGTSMPRLTPAAEVAARARELLDTPQPLVLVVDDDANVRPVLVRLIQRQGLRVVQASDGYAALSMADRLHPDVILLDIKMPGIDGYEVLRQLRRSEGTAKIPVIFLSADEPGGDGVTLIGGQEADEYLEKPITAERLISAINRVVARSPSPDG